MKMNRTFLFESEGLKKEERLCFVKDEQGKLWFDAEEKLQGYEVIYLPCKKNALSQAVAQNVLSQEMQTTVLETLKSKVLSRLSLAKKAGLIVLGLEKVKENYRKELIKSVFLALDAGKDVTKRVSSWEVACCAGFSSEELSQALGQPNVSLVGLMHKPQVKSLLLAHQRYQLIL